MTKPFELPGLLTPDEIVAIVKEHDGDLVQMWNTEVVDGTLEVDSCMNYVLKVQRDKTVKERDEQWIVWIEQNVNWRLDAPYKSTLDPEDFKALKDKLRRPEVK